MVKRRSERRQFDVFANTDPVSSSTHPFLIVLQSSSLYDLDTCVVAPLVPWTQIRQFDRAWPEVAIRSERYRIAIPLLAAISTKGAGTPIDNLERERYRIIAALDLVFTGI